MIKHRVNIKVAGRPVLKAGIRTIPQKIVRWLFGDFQQVYLITPGKTVDSISIMEVEE